MMDEELHLETPAIFRSAIVIAVAALVSHLDPLFPLIWAPRTTALILALVLSALVLFGVDVYEAVTLVGDCARKPADPRNRLGAARDRLRDRPSVPPSARNPGRPPDRRADCHSWRVIASPVPALRTRDVHLRELPRRYGVSPVMSI